MRKIVFYQKAVEDLNEIFNFYYLKNSDTAYKIYDQIILETKILKTFPEAGAHDPQLSNYRALVTRNGLFKIVYFIREETIVITRIWCCRKNPDDFFIDL